MGEDPRLRDRKAWLVRIPEHEIPARRLNGRPTGMTMLVPASERVQFERERRSAIRAAVEAAHIGVGIPPWRPYLRQTARLVEVSETVATALGGGKR